MVHSRLAAASLAVSLLFAGSVHAHDQEPSTVSTFKHRAQNLASRVFNADTLKMGLVAGAAIWLNNQLSKKSASQNVAGAQQGVSETRVNELIYHQLGRHELINPQDATRRAVTKEELEVVSSALESYKKMSEACPQSLLPLTHHDSKHALPAASLPLAQQSVDLENVKALVRAVFVERGLVDSDGKLLVATTVEMHESLAQIDETIKDFITERQLNDAVRLRLYYPDSSTTLYATRQEFNELVAQVAALKTSHAEVLPAAEAPDTILLAEMDKALEPLAVGASAAARKDEILLAQFAVGDPTYVPSHLAQGEVAGPVDDASISTESIEEELPALQSPSESQSSKASEEAADEESAESEGSSGAPSKSPSPERDAELGAEPSTETENAPVGSFLGIGL